MQKHANYLGLAGLIPFFGLPLMVLVNQLSLYEAQSYFSQYSAIILSFLGGIHWYDSFQRSQKLAQLYFAMLPAIIGWVSLVLLNGISMLAVLAVGFLLVLFYDHQELDMPGVYFRMRQKLTGAVIGSHAVMGWLLMH